MKLMERQKLISGKVKLKYTHTKKCYDTIYSYVLLRLVTSSEMAI